MKGAQNNTLGLSRSLKDVTLPMQGSREALSNRDRSSARFFLFRVFFVCHTQSRLLGTSSFCVGGMSNREYFLSQGQQVEDKKV